MPQVNLGQINSLFRNLGDDLVAPILRGMGTRANPGASVPSLTRSVGPIRDTLVRPQSKLGQLLANDRPINAKLGQFGSGSAIIQQQTGTRPPGFSNYRKNPIEQFFQEYGQPAASKFPTFQGAQSLQPGPTSGKYPLNDPLNLLQSQGRYLQRQLQQGVQGGLQRLEGALPTALNPFATRSPGTVLGKIGKAFNPLNPVNLKNSAAGAAVNLLPIGARNQATLQGAITFRGLTPLGVVGAIAAHDMYNPLGLTDSQEAQKIQDMVRGPYTNSQGGDLSARDERGRVWAGRDYGFQSPESFNKLFGANLPTTPGSSTSNSSSAPGTQNSFAQNQAQPRTAPPAPTLPPPPGGPAAERSQRAEMSRIAQQTAQNPDFQRWQDQSTLARQSLQGYNPAAGPLPGAAQSAQDLGMKIWAQKYGPGSTNDLASKVRQGQSGFGVIQNTLANSAATAGLQMPGQLTPTPQVPSPTPFPAAPAQSGFPAPGAPTQEQLSRYPQFNPEDVDLNQFYKFIRGKFNK